MNKYLKSVSQAYWDAKEGVPRRRMENIVNEFARRRALERVQRCNEERERWRALSDGAD